MSIDFSQQLREAGLRVTTPRLAVLDALSAQPHSDTAEVLTTVRTRHTTISHQTVYDCLGALTDAGLLRRFQPASSVALYEVASGDNHHHAVCRECGAITDVACAVGEAPCLHAKDPHGFDIAEAEVIYWGLCAECAASAQPASSPTTATRSAPTPAVAPTERKS